MPSSEVTSTVRHIEIAGAVIVIQTFSDGRILVNGDPVEPAHKTVQAFHEQNDSDPKAAA